MHVSLRDNLREQVVAELNRAGIEIPVETLIYKSAYHQKRVKGITSGKYPYKL
jgi:hypothetical protein